jgi:magnesium-transporting ATPase (P-type)
MCFDKTGTLTEEGIEISGIKPNFITEQGVPVF